MSLNFMMDTLQRISNGKIVLLKMGAFYIAKGRDAVLLNKLLKLKPICLQREVCKVGFPISSLKDYLEKIEDFKYGYVVFDYNSKQNKITQTIKKEGKINKEDQERINCFTCRHSDYYYQKEDKYLEALIEFFRERRKRKQEQ